MYIAGAFPNFPRAPFYFSSASATTSASSVGVPTVKAMYCLPFTMAFVA
jgi:hypothetical protein